MVAYQRAFRDTEGYLIVGVGSHIEWHTPEGEVKQGTILEIESDTALVHCRDGRELRLDLMSRDYGYP